MLCEWKKNALKESRFFPVMIYEFLKISRVIFVLEDKKWSVSYFGLMWEAPGRESRQFWTKREKHFSSPARRSRSVSNVNKILIASQKQKVYRAVRQRRGMCCRRHPARRRRWQNRPRTRECCTWAPQSCLWSRTHCLPRFGKTVAPLKPASLTIYCLSAGRE